MQAAINTRYGSPKVVEIREMSKPEPQAGEVLVRVHATTVNRTDCGMLRAHPFFVRFAIGFFRPKRTVLGLDFAGLVEAVGAGVTSFKPGQRVFGMSPDEFGCHAEYICVPEDGTIAAMPEGLDFKEVVVCEGAWYSDVYMKAFGLGPGHKILIYGGSGAIGTAAVQLAKSYGAEVTAVVATQHLALVKSLGADHAIDYTTGDFTKIGKTFDFILDAVGKTSFFQCRKLLTPDGTFSATDLGPCWQNLFLPIWFSLTGSKRVIFPLPTGSKEVVESLKARLESGEIRTVIDREYPLQQIVEAYRYVESGQKTGIVVINVPAPGDNRES